MLVELCNRYDEFKWFYFTSFYIFLKHGWTAFMTACKGGHLSTAQFLFTQGVDVNSKDIVRYVLCIDIINNDFMIVGFDMR